MPGNNSAFLKDVFHRIGGYSTEITYLDDMDFCLRLRKEGRIIYDPNLIVWVSTRRMDEDGYLRTMLLWLKGDILLLAGKRERMKERYFRKDK
jgi:GT2 family glycosyltransferase